MATHEETRWAHKHQAIMDAATAVFLNKGYLGTSVDEIAAVAAVSKQTVYKHFADKERLFTAIILATTGQIDDLVRLVAATLDNSTDLDTDLGELGRRFITALMQPRLLQLRRLVIANADHFPDLGRAWYQQGFERVLATLAESFQRLTDRGLLQIDDPLLAANHLVGLLLWIPVNRAMFTGGSKLSTDEEHNHYAEAAVRVFLTAYRQP
jgi:TetR/AcrR family transcriptional repressor of mexJK operon